jgi:hypothetical protein
VAESEVDDEKVKRVITLLLGLLREDRPELAEAEVAGVWWVADSLFEWNLRQSHVVYAVQSGLLNLAMEELQTGSPGDWVSVASDPSGKFGAVLNAVRGIGSQTPSEHYHLITAVPGLLDLFLNGLRAFEAADAPNDANHIAIFGLATGLMNTHAHFFEGEVGQVNRAAVRAAASTMRYVLDHPLVWMSEFGCNSNTWIVCSLLLHFISRVWRGQSPPHR